MKLKQIIIIITYIFILVLVRDFVLKKTPEQIGIELAKTKIIANNYLMLRDKRDVFASPQIAVMGYIK